MIDAQSKVSIKNINKITKLAPLSFGGVRGGFEIRDWRFIPPQPSQREGVSPSVS